MFWDHDARVGLDQRKAGQALQPGLFYLGQQDLLRRKRARARSGKVGAASVLAAVSKLDWKWLASSRRIAAPRVLNLPFSNPFSFKRLKQVDFYQSTFRS
jgi:hypothetical protein